MHMAQTLRIKAATAAMKVTECCKSGAPAEVQHTWLAEKQLLPVHARKTVTALSTSGQMSFSQQDNSPIVLLVHMPMIV